MLTPIKHSIYMIFFMLFSFLARGAETLTFPFFDTDLKLELDTSKNPASSYRPLSATKSLIIDKKTYQINPADFVFIHHTEKNYIELYKLYARDLPPSAGTKFMNIVFTFAHRQNADKIELSSLHGSWGFYFSMGFYPITLDGTQCDYPMSLAMTKELIEGKFINDSLSPEVKTKLAKMSALFGQASEHLHGTHEMGSYPIESVEKRLRNLYWQVETPRLQVKEKRSQPLGPAVQMRASSAMIRQFRATFDRLPAKESQIAIKTAAKELFASFQAEIFQAFISAPIAEDYSTEVDKIVAEERLKKSSGTD